MNPMGSIYRRSAPESLSVPNPLFKWILSTTYKLATKAYPVAHTALSIGIGLSVISQLQPIKGTKGSIALLSSGLLLNALAVSILFGRRQMKRIETQLGAFHHYIDELCRMHEWGRALQLGKKNNVVLNQLSVYPDEFSSKIREVEAKLLQQGPRPYYFDCKNMPFEGILKIPTPAGVSFSEWNAIYQEYFSSPSEDQIQAWSQDHNFQAIFTELGMVDTVEPSFKSYGVVVLHSAPEDQMKAQINFIIDQWRKGVRFQALAFTDKSTLLDKKSDPYVLAHFYWENAKSQADFPIELKDLKLGNYTGNSLKEQLAHLPQTEEPVLFVTGAPFIPLQDFLNRKDSPRLDEKLILNQETVGPKIEKVPTAIYLQQIAKYIQVRAEDKQP